jgi:hypothetical protein
MLDRCWGPTGAVGPAVTAVGGSRADPHLIHDPPLALRGTPSILFRWLPTIHINEEPTNIHLGVTPMAANEMVVIGPAWTSPRSVGVVSWRGVEDAD